jgi:hypothetical protein
MEIDSREKAHGSKQKSKDALSSTGQRGVVPNSLRLRVINEEMVYRCKDAILTALGKFMNTSMRLPSVLDLGIDGIKKSDKADRESLRKSLNSEDTLVHELGEALVPYYVSSSRQLDHCRMFI